MINGKWESLTIGNCVTQYTHVNFNKLVRQCSKFYTVRQEDDKDALDVVAQEGSFPKGTYVDNPRCSIGEVLYGVNDGKLVKLRAIIDSTD